MIEINIIPDSAAADIFAGKCCGGALPDQNLEIQKRKDDNPCNI